MTPELRAVIDQNRWCLPTVQAVAALLPADDAELDRLLEQVVADKEFPGFAYVAAAALVAGRPVDARHMREGGTLIPNEMTFCCIAVQMQGEVVDAILHAGEHTVLLPQVKTASQLAAALWWRRHREGQPFPPRLLAAARAMARGKLEQNALTMLCAMTAVTGDERLVKLATAALAPNAPAKHDPDRMATSAKNLAAHYEQLFFSPILSQIPNDPPEALGMGAPRTLRRSVARIGRNELCPCGSGKKYKHCCEAADKERLRLSTDVAGKTYAELRAEPEPYLTAERLTRALPSDVARYDPLKVPRELVDPYLEKLAICKYLDRVTEAFEQIGWAPELERTWDLAAFMVGAERRRDLLERLVAVRGPREQIVDDLDPGSCLLLAAEDPAEKLRLLEEMAMFVLECDKNESERMTNIVYRVLNGEKSALSVLVGRSVIPLVRKRDALDLIQPIQEIRDRLELPTDDPFVDLIEKRYSEETDSHAEDAGALRAALARLEAKANDVRLLQAELDVLRREIDEREKATASAGQQAGSTTTGGETPTATVSSDSQALADLRRKVETLKGHLKERHAERATLRQELEKAHADLQKLREEGAPGAEVARAGASSSAGAAEDGLTLPGGLEGTQPLRTIEFPRKFHETLDHLPRTVGRGALALLGRLAGGESAAFQGVVRLKAAPDVLRARVGIDHRLLFRLLPDRVEVVDLINRRDLERRIKTLG